MGLSAARGFLGPVGAKSGDRFFPHPASTLYRVGASVIEKHFTLRRSDGGVDGTFSLEPAEFHSLATETHRVWQSLGAVTYGPSEAEKASMVFRRSLYIARDMRSGEALTRTNLRVVRPGNGLHPRYYEQLLCMTVQRDVTKGTPATWILGRGASDKPGARASIGAAS